MRYIHLYIPSVPWLLHTPNLSVPPALDLLNSPAPGRCLVCRGFPRLQQERVVRHSNGGTSHLVQNIDAPLGKRGRPSRGYLAFPVHGVLNAHYVPPSLSSVGCRLRCTHWGE